MSVKRRDTDYVDKRMQRLELQVMRPGERLKKLFMDVVKEYMDVFGVNEKDWIMGEARMEVGE